MICTMLITPADWLKNWQKEPSAPVGCEMVVLPLGNENDPPPNPPPKPPPKLPEPPVLVWVLVLESELALVVCAQPVPAMHIEIAAPSITFRIFIVVASWQGWLKVEGTYSRKKRAL